MSSGDVAVLVWHNNWRPISRRRHPNEGGIDEYDDDQIVGHDDGHAQFDARVGGGDVEAWEDLHRKYGDFGWAGGSLFEEKGPA